MKAARLFACLAVSAPLWGAEPKFRHETIDPEIKIGYGLAVADVDGDKKVDILLVDQSDVVWYQNPSWKKHVIASKLTIRDNVCIAAKDLDGDGKAEIAVGANWNPGETTKFEESGSVHYLIAPEDRTQRWKAVTLPHEPTVHRMHWAQGPNGPALVVLPLHGVGNKNGEGANAVKVHRYDMPAKNADDPSAWKQALIDQSMHVTHNFDPQGALLAIGGREGLIVLDPAKEGSKKQVLGSPGKTLEPGGGLGEVRWGPYRAGDAPGSPIFAAIEPFHGHQLAVYETDGKRVLLDDTLAQGHALACGQFLPGPRQQVVAGWRNPNKDNKVGIKLYVEQDGQWKAHVLDDNGMACEDLKAADFNGDGKLDLVAAGRATKNVKLYWNEN